MKRDKPYRLQKKEKYDQRAEQIANIKNEQLKREPCRPPCPQQKKQKK